MTDASDNAQRPSKEQAFIERLRSYGRFYVVPVTEHSERYLAEWLRESNYKFSIPILPGETLDQAMERRPAETRAEQPMLSVRSRGPVGPNDVIVDATELVKHVTFRMILKVPADALKASAVRDQIAPNNHCPKCDRWFWADKFDGHKCVPVNGTVQR